MRLQDITATPHPLGNRIDLAWVNPDPDQYPGVRVVRREGTHPTSPEDGVLVAEGEGLQQAADVALKGETMYYYALFPYQGDPPEYQVDRHNRTAAMATAPYDMAGRMYDLLPGIYHRYDTALPSSVPEGMPEEDEDKGQLRRFLDLPGSQLDQIYSFARAMLDLYDIDAVDGRLLPLLAQWIGWETDYRQEIDTQRNEVRSAPYVYQRIGLIPTLESTVKRIIGWESRTKEFVHNIFRSNCPERLNIWVRQRDVAGEWSEPTEPLSLDFAYEGRPTAVHDGDGTLWLFYHTLGNDQWDIWYKSYRQDAGWAPSQPLTHRTPTDVHPTAVVQGNTLWVFWASYTDTDHRWRIHYRTRSAGQWSSIATYPDPETDPGTDRRRPWAVVDRAGGLWLFWLERVGVQWRLKYNRYDGTTWELGTAGDFPPDLGVDPRVEDDLYVLSHPTDLTQSLWLFWARRVPTGEPGQTQWQIAYRVKQGIAPAVSDWTPVRTLPKVETGYHDREPAALVDGDGNVELFWSSNRDRSWSILRQTVDVGTHGWATPQAITGNPYSQRDPLPISAATATWLIYRSNRSLVYTSAVFSATETLDARYAGCTTVDTRNLAKIALRGQFEDFQTYSYAAGRDGKQASQDWYARDTVGIYLTPDPKEVTLIVRNQNLIERVLRQFLPIQVRTVFIIEPAVAQELVYTYDFETADPQRLIDEVFFDSTIPETYFGPREAYQDAVPGWVWVRSWSEAVPDHRTVDFATLPIHTRFRTWHIGLQSGG